MSAASGHLYTPAIQEKFRTFVAVYVMPILERGTGQITATELDAVAIAFHSLQIRYYFSCEEQRAAQMLEEILDELRDLAGNRQHYLQRAHELASQSAIGDGDRRALLAWLKNPQQRANRRPADARTQLRRDAIYHRWYKVWLEPTVEAFSRPSLEPRTSPRPGRPVTKRDGVSTPLATLSDAPAPPTPRVAESSAGLPPQDQPDPAAATAVATPSVYEIELAPDQIEELRRRVARDRDRDWLRSRVELFRTRIREDQPCGLALDEHRAQVEHKVFSVDATLLRERDIWFIGDLHGDLLALEAAIMHIESTTHRGAPLVVFLGDLIDDGPFSKEVVCRFLDLAFTEPEHYCLVTGNHDASLRWLGDRFGSDVSPHDFTDQLNDTLDDDLAVAIGKLTIALFTTTPNAIFLSSGLLITHGGIPQTDLHSQIVTPADLNSELCRQDFMWTRAHPRVKRKRPSRTTKGDQFGWEDLDDFLSVASRALSFTVAHVVRGHDHVAARYDDYPSYPRHTLLTINSMSHRLRRESGGSYVRTPCVARYDPAGRIEVHRLNLPEDLVRDVYPEGEP